MLNYKKIWYRIKLTHGWLNSILQWQSPFFNTSLQPNILWQDQDADFSIGIFMKFLFFTYFFWKTFTHNLSALLTISQDVFSTNALFISSVFLKPRPPILLGVQMDSQLLRQCPSLLSSFLPHQKFQLRESNLEHTWLRASNLEHTCFGRSKEAAWYEGIDFATDVIRVPLPPMINFHFPPLRSGLYFFNNLLWCCLFILSIWGIYSYWPS